MLATAVRREHHILSSHHSLLLRNDRRYLTKRRTEERERRGENRFGLRIPWYHYILSLCVVLGNWKNGRSCRCHKGHNCDDYRKQ